MKKFVKKIAQGGVYTIIFMCIAAIGISAYVMNVANNTAKSVKESFTLEDSVEIPFPESRETMFDVAEKLDMPSVIQDETAVISNEAETETTQTEKIEEETTGKVESADTEAVMNETRYEEVAYTMAVIGTVSEPFSGEELVKSKTMGDWRIHSGVDIKAEVGTEVKAIADGIIKSIDNDSMLGNTVAIEHADGIISVYANLHDEISVKTGDKVKGGSVIGKVGQSALCECLEDAHLHLEVIKDGKAIDPLSLFPAGEE